MHLVMFDIDGTLTETNAIDTDCFAQAMSEILHLPPIDRDWSHYKHVTDAGIASEIVETHFGRTAFVGELEQIKTRFAELLNEAIAGNPGQCRPVGGAGAMLANLLAKDGIAVALATGGWARTAEIKLQAAGLNIGQAALASADDAISREQIMLMAKSRAIQMHRLAEFESFTYVGDGVWDLHASRALGIPFIAIAEGVRAEKLKAQGAEQILPDFRDYARFDQMLRSVQAGSSVRKN